MVSLTTQENQPKTFVKSNLNGCLKNFWPLQYYSQVSINFSLLKLFHCFQVFLAVFSNLNDTVIIWFYSACTASKQTQSFFSEVITTLIWNEEQTSKKSNKNTLTLLYLTYTVLCKITWFKEWKQLCLVAKGMASRHHCLNNCILYSGFVLAKELSFLLLSLGSKNSEWWCAEIFCKVLYLL